MNKKGFTLVEIIVSISLIVVLGLGSFFAVRYVSNKELIKKLEQITDRALNAAHVYIETNEETYNQLYNNKNGVSLPLQLLVDEGLLNIDNTELTESDIKDQYVITFLGSTVPSDSCEQITSTTSWGNDKEIYLCLNQTINQTGGTSSRITTGKLRDVIINNAKNSTGLDNSTYFSNSIIDGEQQLLKLKDNEGDSYYYRGPVVDNYVNFAGMCWRIVRVQGDGSTKLILDDSTGECGRDGYQNIWSIGRGIYGYTENPSGVYLNSYGNKNSSDTDTFTMKEKLDEFYGNFNETTQAQIKEEKWCLGNINDRFDYDAGAVVSKVSSPSYSGSRDYQYLTYVKLSPNLRFSEEQNYLKEISFKCDNGKNETFISSRIGTLTAEEVYMAGVHLQYYIDDNNVSNTYLNTNYDIFMNSDKWEELFGEYNKYDNLNWATLSIGVYDYHYDSDTVFHVGFRGYMRSDYGYDALVGGIYDPNVYNRDLLHIRPSIVLNENVEISEGFGTFKSPYVVKS